MTGLVLERGHPAAAVWTVVEVLLGELVAVVAEPQVLHRPCKLGGRGGKRQQLANHLELLSGLAVDVYAIGLRFEHDFAPRGWGSQTVSRTDRHESAC